MAVYIQKYTSQRSECNNEEKTWNAIHYKIVLTLLLLSIKQSHHMKMYTAIIPLNSKLVDLYNRDVLCFLCGRNQILNAV
jgi:hypothetical protein